MKPTAPTHELHPRFKTVAVEARLLAADLEKAERDFHHQQKGEEVQRIKDEALGWLGFCGTPPSLVVLIGRLLKDPRAKSIPRQRPRLTDAQWIAAEIEAARPLDPTGGRPSDMNHSELTRALKEKMGAEAPSRTTVLKWKDDPAYRRLVFTRREEA